MVAMLEPVLPPEVRIWVGDCAVIVRDAQQGPGAGTGEEVVLVDFVYHFGLTPEEEPRQRLINACKVVLDRVQEFVAEATAMPWPGENSFPSPHVTIRNGMLMCAYGSDNEPVLALQSVALDQLGIGEG